MKITLHPGVALPISLLIGALLGCLTLAAQGHSAPARITTSVDEASRTTLHGNVSPLARAEFDQGETAPATQLSHVRLLLARTAEQQAALDQYLADLQDASSPNYHKWLTPEQFGALYGPADSDVAAIVAWLESHGLTLESVSKGRTDVAFSGTVSQVEEAFHTTIHSFLVNRGQTSERQFTSNTSDPQIPSALAAVVSGVAHLNTIQPRPHGHRAEKTNLDPETLRTAASGPGLTDTSSTFFYITPADAATIYNTPNAFNANFSSGSSYTGAGVKIGIGGDATIVASVVGNYRSTFLGSATLPTLNYCTSTTSCSSTAGSGYVSGDADEAYLDTELSSGLAPGASIYYYASTDLNTGMAAAINANLVDIFSLSFGQCEQDLSTSDNAWYNNLYQQAAGQGIAVTVSTGDSGSAGCDGDAGSAVAARGLSVSGLASTPYNIAVGGTDFYALENSFSSYVSATLGSPASYYRTALGYIPESIWNDSTTADGSPLSANVPETGKYASIVAGSGGVSSCSSNYSVDAGNSIVAGLCISGYNKPSWQTGSGVPADGKRDLPDISLMSGNGYDGATWLVCDNDSNTLAFSTSKGTLNCSNIPGGYFDGFGGTSTAAPAFAGILALVQQKTGSRLGQAAQNLYQLYNGAYGSAIFHDVAVGNNSVPCTSGTTNCALNSAGHNFLTGYNALTGYDLASGLGSVDATQLVNHWGAGVVAGPTFTLAATTPTAIATPGGSTTSTISVTAVGGYTGSVTLACTLTTYPSGASFLPVCSIPPTAVAMGGSAIATVNTTAATAALSTPKLPGRGYFGASGGTLLALLIFFGIPARRRSWRSMLGMLMLLAALGGMTACGSGGSTGGGGGGGSTGTPGTTVGLYIFTVTGTGNPAVATSPTTTFSVTVN